MDVSDHPITWIISTVATTAIFTTLLGFLPHIAAVVALLWYVIQIYESDTFRRWRAQRQMRKLARLKSRVMMMESRPAPMPKNMKDEE